MTSCCEALPEEEAEGMSTGPSEDRQYQISRCQTSFRPKEWDVGTDAQNGRVIGDEYRDDLLASDDQAPRGG